MKKIALLFFFIIPSIVLADDTGFLSPSANTIKSAPSWSNPQDGYASDDAYATTTNTGSWVSYADFNIPAIPIGSTIDGIEVSAEGKTIGRDIDISLSWNHFNYTSVIAAGFTEATDVVKLVGGATNTFGRTWSVEDFTNGNFRVRATAHSFSPNGTMFSLDQILVKVYYTKKNLTPTITADDKIYDGNNTATVAACNLIGVISPDVVTCSASGATFDDKNVGTDKIVTAGIMLGSADSGNYTYDSSATTTASITARNLTITAAGINKVYDGNTTATTTLSDDRIVGDSLTLSFATTTFADPNAAVGIVVSVTGILISGGVDAGNYALVNTTASTTADISQYQGIITLDNSNLTRTYDGNPQSVNVLSTNPAGLSYAVTYNGSTTPPTMVGTFNVLATITDPNYAGTDSVILTIVDNVAPAVTPTVDSPPSPPRGGNGPLWGVTLGSNSAPIVPVPIPTPTPKPEVKTITLIPEFVESPTVNKPATLATIEAKTTQVATIVLPKISLESQVAAAAVAAADTDSNTRLWMFSVAAILIVLIGGFYLAFRNKKFLK
ncbi:MAG TPA: YDG domain-containing protein [Candidatus Paceibacterota bacterium]